MLKNTIYLLLCAIFCISCSDSKRNIKEYYFPVGKLKEGLIYEYETAEDERLPPFYWFYQSKKEAAKTFLIGTYYEHDYTPFQYIKEEIVENGMTLADFNFYDIDTITNKLKAVPVEIQSKNVFPFSVNEEKPGVLLYSIKWNDPRDEKTEMTLIRNRQFAGDTIYIYQNKKYEAVQFYVKELIDNFNEGHLEQEYDGLEIYAKNLGLVYFEKNVAKDFIIKYKLKDTYDKKIWEEKKR